MQLVSHNPALRSHPSINRIFIIEHTEGVYSCLAQSARKAVEVYHRDTGHGSLTKIIRITERLS